VVHSIGYFLPPDEMCTLTFMRDVLKGEKKLLMASATTGIPDIPRIREINAAVIWADIKGDETIKQYFPDIFTDSERTPNRDYMFKVESIGFCKSSSRYLFENA